MIHHTVEGGKSSWHRSRRRLGLFGGLVKTFSGICACLLVVVGGAQVAAQPGFLPTPPPTQVGDTKFVPSGLTGAGQAPAAGGQQGPAAVPPLSQPKPLAPFGAGQVRLPRMPGDPGTVGAPPVPAQSVLKDYGNYVKGSVRPEATLDVAQGQTHLMILQDVPKRIQIGDEGVAAYTLISPTEISILGKSVGSTTLNLWFTDVKDKNKEKVLSYLVRVIPDPTLKLRMEMAYKALEAEIARYFPDSRVSLVLCGDKLLVCGQAKDIAECNYILEIVRSNLPTGLIREFSPRRIRGIPYDQAIRSNNPADVHDGVLPPAASDYEIEADDYVVNMLRVPGEQQVSLMVTVVEVNRAAARSIGVNFNLFNNRGINYFSNTTGQIVPPLGATTFNPLNPAAQVNGILQGNYNNLPATLDNGHVQLAISALKELNYARTLAEPNLVTLNGRTASFTAGDLFPVPFVAGFTSTGLEGVGFFPVGVQLQFTPYITDKDKIRLQINAEVSDRDLTIAETLIAGSSVPSLTTRNFTTTVELRDGQTLAVAGLIQNKLGTDSSRVPFFGDLPVIGRLFSFDRTHAEEQELVILITPELVHPMERKKVPPLPGCDIFEPSDCEFFLMGRLESRHDYDYRSAVMTDMARMIRYHHAEQIYIVGPHGHSHEGEIGLPPVMVDGPPDGVPMPVPPGAKSPAAPTDLHPPAKLPKAENQ